MNRAERRRLAKNRQPDLVGRTVPTKTDQLFELALSHHQHDRLDEAKKGYRRVIQVAPAHIDAWTNLGIVYHQLGKLDDAISCYEQATAIQPDYIHAHFNLANVYKDMGEYDRAIAGYQKTISLDSAFAGGYFNLGFVLSEVGQLADARAAFRKVISLIPDAADAHRQLASITRQQVYGPEIEAMEQLYESRRVSDLQRQEVAFGLAKAYEDLGEYAKSFAFLAHGNRLKRSRYHYSTGDQKTYFERYKQTFDKTLFDKYRGCGFADPTPVFILGMPRSGTSLVEQILASHPNVHGAGELATLSQTLAAAVGTVALPDYQHTVRTAAPQLFSEIGAKYVDLIRAHSDSAVRISDKMPQNFLHIGMIKLALPNARIIHCKRAAEDTCLSIFKTYFPGNVHEYACDLTELGQYYRMYEDLMAHWQNVLPGFVHDIQYEDLIDDQEPLTRDLLAHCGLDWDPACLEFYKTDRAVRTASLVQVRTPLYKSSVQLWRRYEAELHPLLHALGC